MIRVRLAVLLCLVSLTFVASAPLFPDSVPLAQAADSDAKYKKALAKFAAERDRRNEAANAEYEKVADMWRPVGTDRKPRPPQL